MYDAIASYANKIHSILNLNDDFDMVSLVKSLGGKIIFINTPEYNEYFFKNCTYKYIHL